MYIIKICSQWCGHQIVYLSLHNKYMYIQAELRENNETKESWNKDSDIVSDKPESAHCDNFRLLQFTWRVRQDATKTNGHYTAWILPSINS